MWEKRSVKTELKYPIYYKERDIVGFYDLITSQNSHC